MLRQPDPLRDVLLEDKTEAAPLSQTVDLCLERRAERHVLHLVEEDVEFAAERGRHGR
jgi:hypothetical protein